MYDLIKRDSSDFQITSQNTEVALPQVFDPQRIQEDMRMMNDRGMLGKYVYALKRRFNLKQEIELINRWTEYYAALKPVIDSAQAIQQSSAAHQVAMEKESAKHQEARSNRQEHRAREAEAVLRQMEAAQKIEKLLYPKPPPGPRNSYDQIIDGVLHESEEAMQSRIRVIKDSNLSEEQRRRLFEAIAQREFERGNRDDD
ncbi:hypothetical protein ACFL34_05620 [Candidatus Sumerlaeota bacterium]